MWGRRSKGLRRALILRPVTSVKHYLPIGPGVSVGLNVPILAVNIQAVSGFIDETVPGNANLVPINSHINRVMFNFRGFNEGTAAPIQSMAIMIRKNVDGRLPAPSAAEMTNPFGVTWKRWIWHWAVAQPGSVGGFPMGLPDIKVPRKHRLFRENDALEVYIMFFGAGTTAGDYCGSAVFKHYI